MFKHVTDQPGERGPRLRGPARTRDYLVKAQTRGPSPATTRLQRAPSLRGAARLIQFARIERGRVEG